MRYADMPRDVSIDNFPSLNVSEVTLSQQYSFNVFNLLDIISFVVFKIVSIVILQCIHLCYPIIGTWVYTKTNYNIVGIFFFKQKLKQVN